MSTIRKAVFLAIIPLLAFTAYHKFYVSVTHINYSEKDTSLQITSRIFIDDFEQVILERYGEKCQLATEEETQLADFYIEKYLRTKIVIKVNGEVGVFKFLGKAYDDDIMICYMEIADVNLQQLKSLEIQNEVLTELFEEQQNVVHFKIKDRKKSFVLIKENNKGMLNL